MAKKTNKSRPAPNSMPNRRSSHNSKPNRQNRPQKQRSAKKEDSTFKGNLHYFFWRSYKGVDDNETLERWKLPVKELQDWKDNLNKISNSRFLMKTTYPGLLVGLGYPHDKPDKKLEGYIDQGFSFDYTTGVPVIPGASVKGALRSAFRTNPGYVSDKLRSIIIDRTKMSKERLEEIITPVYIYEDLCNQIFGSSDSSGNDIFFDAFPDPEKNKGDRAAPLELDYITPHIQKDAEKSEKINAEITEYKGKAEPSTGIEHMVRANATINPNPVTILKVESGVSFRFTFLLYDTIIENKNKNETVTVTAVHKKKLFMKILEDFGVGAKTNVGYGHLVPVEE